MISRYVRGEQVDEQGGNVKKKKKTYQFSNQQDDPTTLAIVLLSFVVEWVGRSVGVEANVVCCEDGLRPSKAAFCFTFVRLDKPLRLSGVDNRWIVGK